MTFSREAAHSEMGSERVESAVERTEDPLTIPHRDEAEKKKTFLDPGMQMYSFVSLDPSIRPHT